MTERSLKRPRAASGRAPVRKASNKAMSKGGSISGDEMARRFVVAGLPRGFSSKALERALAQVGIAGTVTRRQAGGTRALVEGTTTLKPLQRLSCKEAPIPTQLACWHLLTEHRLIL